MPEADPAERRRRKLYVLSDELGLTREDRIDLASMLLRRTMASWSELDEDQVIRILDALEGHQLLTELEKTRPAGQATT